MNTTELNPEGIKKDDKVQTDTGKGPIMHVEKVYYGPESPQRGISKEDLEHPPNYAKCSWFSDLNDPKSFQTENILLRRLKKVDREKIMPEKTFNILAKLRVLNPIATTFNKVVAAIISIVTLLTLLKGCMS